LHGHLHLGKRFGGLHPIILKCFPKILTDY
jgi:hypothetical protein